MQYCLVTAKLQDLVSSQHQVSSHCRTQCKEQSQQPAFTATSYLFLTTILAVCSAEINLCITHFNSLSDLLCCSALARAAAPAAVSLLSLRLQWDVIRHEHT